MSNSERLSQILSECAGPGDFAFYMARQVRGLEELLRQAQERIGRLEYLIQLKDRQITELTSDDPVIVEGGDG